MDPTQDYEALADMLERNGFAETLHTIANIADEEGSIEWANRIRDMLASQGD